MNCQKCEADISDTFERDDPSCGITAGWYCDACDFGIAEWEAPREPMEGDMPIMTAKEFRGDRPLGTPLSELRCSPAIRAIPTIRATLDMKSSSGSLAHGDTTDALDRS